MGEKNDLLRHIIRKEYSEKITSKSVKIFFVRIIKEEISLPRLTQLAAE